MLSMPSTRVVFPWSTWAMIAILRSSARSAFVAAGLPPATARGALPERLIDLATEPGTKILGAPGKDQLGSDLRTGDLNDDGMADLAAGAQWGTEAGGDIVGRAYAPFGRSV